MVSLKEPEDLEQGWCVVDRDEEIVYAPMSGPFSTAEEARTWALKAYDVPGEDDLEAMFVEVWSYVEARNA